MKYDGFYPAELWLDNNGVHINAHGGGLFFESGTYYWFGEHKTEGTAGNYAHVGVHCYSSTDLYNWNDEGIALSVDKENKNSDIYKGNIIERPKVVFNKKTKKYIMYFHLELDEDYISALTGIAISDTPSGPYTYVHSLRPNAGYWPKNVEAIHQTNMIPSLGQTYGGDWLPQHPDTLNLLGRDFEGGQMSRDMTIFIDEDEKAYHIYSSEENSTLHIALLSDDYMSYTGEYMRVFVHRYMEAPVVFKKNEKYYIIASGCTGWAPNAARSAIAASIWGPWEEIGNPCRGELSEITFGGQGTFAFKIENTNQYVFMADKWNPNNAIDGRYIWLPIEFEDEKPILRWQDKWKY